MINLNNKIENKTKQTNILWFIGFSLFIYAIYFFLNRKTAFLNDDYTYRLVFEYWRVSADPVKVSSLHDIYISMTNHYKLWGGRIPVHTVIQLLLWLVDKKIFDIINSMMVVLLGILVYFHANFGKKRNLFLYILTCTMIWFFMPQPELAMLDLTNSVNNMWVCVYILIFLIPYRIILAQESLINHKAALAVLILPFGFLAGWSNEPGGAAAGAMAVFVTIYLIKIKRKLPVWTYFGIASLAVGWAFMTFAPGYRNKADKYYGVENVLKNAISDFGRIQSNLIRTSLKSLWPMLLLLIISAIVIYVIKKNKITGKRIKPSAVRKKIIADFDFIPGVFYAGCAFVSVAIYIISPDFHLRYLFPAALFLIISACTVISEILEEVNIKEKKERILLAVIMCICCVSVSVNAFYEYNIAAYNYELTASIEQDIKSQVEQGKKDVVITGEYRFLSRGRYTIYKYGFITFDVIWGGLDSGYEINRMFAANFGADTYVNQADMSYIESK